MNVYVHLPEKQEEISDLKAEISSLHAQIIIDYIKDLPCSAEKKIEIIKSICEKIRLSEI